MRNSKLKALELEQELDNRRQSRKNGYSIMPIRDKGWGHIQDHTGHRVTFIWPVETEDGWSFPEGKFKLIRDGVEMVFDADDFRRWLRWV